MLLIYRLKHKNGPLLNDQNKYLNCYNLPYKDPLLDNKYGYVNKSSVVPCSQNVNYHYNQVSNGFKFYDTRINPTSGRVTLTPSGKLVQTKTY
jgi:hypothetical protein